MKRLDLFFTSSAGMVITYIDHMMADEAFSICTRAQNLSKIMSMPVPGGTACISGEKICAVSFVDLDEQKPASIATIKWQKEWDKEVAEIDKKPTGF